MGTGDAVEPQAQAWEQALVQEVLRQENPGLRAFIHAASSFGEVSKNTIVNDIKWVACGWLLLAVYVMATLRRPCAAAAGLASVAMACVVSLGVSAALGLPYGPLTNVLPVLLLGLGVDDMYVIGEAWGGALGGGGGDYASRASRALRHAGVGVVVTTMSDGVAFLVGPRRRFLPSGGSACTPASASPPWGSSSARCSWRRWSSPSAAATTGRGQRAPPSAPVGHS